jgi:acyl-CoA thioester hydrolase
MGWVYYANYLYYFEVGRSDLIRSLWKSYREMEADGIILPVVESHCRYVKGARYEDELEITSVFSAPGPARIRFDYEIRRVDCENLLVEGYTIHCFVNKSGRPMRMPDDLVRALL